MVVQQASGCDVAGQDIVGDIVESLFARLVLEHVEGIHHLSDEDPFAACLDCVDWRA